MPELASVAICIPTFNQAQYLIAAVTSACNQTHPNVEVWVADDAGTDDTPAVMAALGQQFPRLHYYRQPQNLGIAGNNTWLLSQPQTDFIVRLDSDDLLEPHYVATLLALFEQYPAAGYAHSAVQEIDEYSQPRTVRRVARAHAFLDAETALRASVSGYRVAANICMFRAKALRELNFYAGRPDYTEDYDLSVRMADAGYGNIYSPQILSSYRVWTDAKGTRPKRKALELKGLIRIYQESLIPAFEKRSWNLKPLEQNRRRLALIHAASCHAAWFSAEEQAGLIALLKELGESPALKLRLILLQWGWAGYFAWWHRTELQLKGLVKGWLRSAKPTPTPAK
jgi:GT2 family glycosyltransferase